MHGGPARVVRALVLAVGLSLSSVLLPTAINIGTGGTPPAVLAPYAGWTWAVIGLLWALTLGIGAWEVLAQRGSMVTSRPVDHPRNRPNALDWVERHVLQRTEQSLAAKARIALELADRPGATRPSDLTVQPVGGQECSVPPDADIGTVFDQLQDSMLILGAPGAGKTTLLLELATSLIAAAREDPERPIPVVLDLAKWSETGRRRSRRRRANESAPEPTPANFNESPPEPTPANFTEWLTGELRKRYTIPPQVTETWLAEGKLVLLFDGLDEVADKDREQCVDELNELQKHSGVPQIAVCSREDDYERLTSKLRLQGAIGIQPLNRDQVLAYFADDGTSLSGVRTALQRDPELWELLDSPLMLNIMALAYSGQSLTATEDIPGRRRELFDAYVCEVLARRGKASPTYSPRETVRTLWFLAQGADDSNEDKALTQRLPFYYSRPPDAAKLVHSIFRPVMLAGALAGAVVPLALRFGVAAGVLVGMAGLVAILFGSIVLAVRSDEPEFEFPASLRWTLGGTAAAIGLLLGGTVSGIGLLAGSATTLWAPVLAALAMSVSFFWRPPIKPPIRGLLQFATLLVLVWLGPTEALVVGGVVGILVFRLWIADTSAASADGENSFAADFRRHTFWAAAAAVAAIGVSAALGTEWSGPVWELATGLALGCGAIRLIPNDLDPDLSVVTDTLCLRAAGYFPLRRGRFLRHAADRSLLSKSGSEYRFVHLLVRDHLAECDPDALGAKAEVRARQFLT
ncbi:hypothetical protein AB0L13_45320 [Saccharopolyspora shandongensis]|uniref:hypothetical protein n=1 Tax=Saccharopolyspora shandongensis TaxID=418495 RepID=UPI00343DF4BC